MMLPFIYSSGDCDPPLFVLPCKSGSDCSDDAAAFITAGAQRVLVKPVKAAHLKLALLQLLHDGCPVTSQTHGIALQASGASFLSTTHAQ